MSPVEEPGCAGSGVVELTLRKPEIVGTTPICLVGWGPRSVLLVARQGVTDRLAGPGVDLVRVLVWPVPWVESFFFVAFGLVWLACLLVGAG